MTVIEDCYNIDNNIRKFVVCWSKVKIVKKPIKPLYLWLVALVLLIGGIVAFHFARVLNVPIHSTVPELNTIQQFQQQMDADIDKMQEEPIS